MKKALEIAFSALTPKIIIQCSEHMTEDQLDDVAQYVDWNDISDSMLSSSNHFAFKFKWSKYIEKMRALRITVATQGYIDLVSFDGYDFKISEVIKSIKVNPNILKKIKIKIDALDKYDMINVLSSGHESLLDIVSTDGYDINMIEKFRILEVYGYSEKAIESLDIIGDLDDNPLKYHIRKVIKHTGDKYINYLELDRLYPSDWIDILSDDPYLVDYIDIDDFLRGDPYYLIQLCYIFPEYLDYITGDNSHKISSLGWEELLINFSDHKKELIGLCDFDDLEERSWETISREKPNLMQYKL